MSNAPEIEILVVDDDRELAETLREFLSAEGYAVATANSAASALEFYQQHSHLALALLDVVMPQSNGIALMEELHRHSPELPVVIMTGFATIETAVDAIKRGAEDYLTKPFDRDAVRKKIGRIMEVHRLRQRVAKLEADLGHSGDPFQDLIFVSKSMQKVVERARTVAATDAAVLIVGETGTGKERLARAIHRASRRASAEFVAVNCGALPHELIESELFGVRRGAYTGAYADMPGVFRAATKGLYFSTRLAKCRRTPRSSCCAFFRKRKFGRSAARSPLASIPASSRPRIGLLRNCDPSSCAKIFIFAWLPS